LIAAVLAVFAALTFKSSFRKFNYEELLR